MLGTTARAVATTMNLLHIETSTAVCSVALSRGQELLVCRDIAEGMNHAAILAPLIKELMAEVGWRPSSLQAISVSSGPGSYTGLRVGSSTAKAMAYTLEIPLVAVPTLKALAVEAFRRHPEASRALPMIDARRNEVYAALYDRSMAEVWPVSSVILDRAFFETGLPSTGNIICCGDGALKIGDLALGLEHIIIDPEILCSAGYLVSPACDLLDRQEKVDVLHFVPYYHKPPNITVSKKEGFIAG